MKRTDLIVGAVRRHLGRLGLALVALASVLTATWAVSSPPSAPSPAPAPATTVVLDRWGVDHVSIHRTANGHMLDLRYRVVDPRRAASLLAEESAAYLVHPRTGRQLQVPDTPKAGRLRTTTSTPEAGRSYFALFANPGRVVERGDQVSIVLGDLRTDLNVE